MSEIYSSSHDRNGYLLIKNIRIENANAISGPLTYGFPALSGFLGFVHALSRELSQDEDFSALRLDGCLVACQDLQLHAYRDKAYKPYVFNQKRFPIEKDGKTAPMIEEGRCHLTVHLVMRVYGDRPEVFEHEEAQEWLKERILQHRLVGGTIVSLDRRSAIRYFPEGDTTRIKNALLPAFVLLDAHEQLRDVLETIRSSSWTQDLRSDVSANMTSLDALIEMATIHVVPDPETGKQSHTKSIKQGRGWLVPIPVGYQGISNLIEPQALANSRYPDYTAQYVETIYSLGKWVFPNAIDNLDRAFWHYHHDPEQDLYLIQTL